MPGGVILRRPELPDQVDWEKALILAGHCFGLSLPGRSLHADNLEKLGAALDEKLRAQADAALALPAALERWYAAIGLASDGVEDHDRRRLVTAHSGAQLMTALIGKRAVEQVRALASFEAKTSPEALGRSLPSGRRGRRSQGTARAGGQGPAPKRARDPHLLRHERGPARSWM